MIKKDTKGKVVMFEDESIAAARSQASGTKDLKAVESVGGKVLTPEQAQAEYDAAIKAIDVAADETLKKLTMELGAEVAKLDLASQIDKRAAKERFKIVVNEADRVRRERVMLAEVAYKGRQEAIWAQYRENIEPINARLESGKAEIEAVRQTDKEAALTTHKARLAAISKAKISDAKVEAVAAESLPAAPS